MSRQAVRNFKLPVNKATIFEYYFYSPYTNLHICIPSVHITMSVKVPDNKTFGDVVKCN